MKIFALQAPLWCSEGGEYVMETRASVLAGLARPGAGGARLGQRHCAPLWRQRLVHVSRARTRLARQGQRCASAQCNHVPPRLSALEGELLAQVAAHPDQTLQQLCQWAQERGVGLSTTAMWKTLARLGLTLKKRPSTLRSSSAPM